MSPSNSKESFLGDESVGRRPRFKCNVLDECCYCCGTDLFMYNTSFFVILGSRPPENLCKQKLSTEYSVCRMRDGSNHSDRFPHQNSQVQFLRLQLRLHKLEYSEYRPRQLALTPCLLGNGSCGTTKGALSSYWISVRPSVSQSVRAGGCSVE